MKRFSIFVILFYCLACNQSPQINFLGSKKPSNIVYNNYNDSTINGFLISYLTNHISSFKQVDGYGYDEFCEDNDLKPNDSLNLRSYFTVQILHKLFTSKTAKNGSVGDIINIPYYWHWVNPNPRHDIIDTKTNQKLNQLKTLNTYPKYASFADIDRTPQLFLSDLFGDIPKYKSSYCNSFSSFGWCSEREMSFVYLLELLGLKAKVIAEDNHSWSVIWVTMTSKTNIKKDFNVKVDNTFDVIEWNKLLDEDKLNWSQYVGNSSLSKWYNAQAHNKLNNIKISPSAIKYIEEATVEYIQKNNQ